MRIGVPKETAEGERRVALVPEVVRKLTGGDGGLEVVVERGAGAGALIPDAQYEEAGAQMVDDPAASTTPRSWSRSRRPTPRRSVASVRQRADRLPPAAHGRARRSGRIAQTGATSFAMEAIPRISRAQSMDALSLAGEHRRLPGGADRRARRSAASSRC